MSKKLQKLVDNGIFKGVLIPGLIVTHDGRKKVVVEVVDNGLVLHDQSVIENGSSVNIDGIKILLNANSKCTAAKLTAAGLDAIRPSFEPIDVHVHVEEPHCRCISCACMSYVSSTGFNVSVLTKGDSLEADCKTSLISAIKFMDHMSVCLTSTASPPCKLLSLEESGYTSSKSATTHRQLCSECCKKKTVFICFYCSFVMRKGKHTMKPIFVCPQESCVLQHTQNCATSLVITKGCESQFKVPDILAGVIAGKRKRG
jgi:hypothetical protein